ncbi:MAG: lyase family protein [Acidimicrobiales bacterium]
MIADNLFDRIVTTDRLLAATGGEAWITAMLDAEVALAKAEADTGVIPHEAAKAIESASRPKDFDVATIARAARLGGNPVIPLVEMLRAKVASAGKDWVHWGATSQDILDTAAVLVSRRSGRMILEDLARLASGCASMADEHRGSLMTARTLLQPALPTTFGAKAAGWLFATTESRAMLATSLENLPAQLGGAGGTLASLGSQGLAVAEAYSTRLGLKVPPMPWHAVRIPLVALSSALAIAAGTSAKISGDVALLMQAEVAEVSEPAAPGRGASSTLPHKRNPVGAAAVGAAARRCAALAGSMFESLSGEHERSLVAWPVEWQTLGDLLALAGGAVARSAETVNGLEVDVKAMNANLAARAGALLSENVSLALTGRLGREASRAAVARALAASPDGSSGSVAAALLADPVVAAASTPDEVGDLLDPGGYLGSVAVWIDRVLSAAADSTAQDERGVQWGR